jgi:hypothetical protein
VRALYVFRVALSYGRWLLSRFLLESACSLLNWGWHSAFISYVLLRVSFPDRVHLSCGVFSDSVLTVCVCVCVASPNLASGGRELSPKEIRHCNVPSLGERGGRDTQAKFGFLFFLLVFGSYEALEFSLSLSSLLSGLQT